MSRTSSSGIIWVAVVAALLGLVGPGQAAMITYTFSGTGTGDLNGNNFTNASFRVTVIGDITNIFPFLPGTLDIVNLPATIEISGLGTVNFSNPVYVFNNQPNTVVGFGDYTDMDFQGDFWDQSSNLLATYGLNTSFGPITTTQPTFAIFTDTNRGFLSLEQTGSATFQASLASVPEPSSAVLLCLGIASLARPRRLMGAFCARVGVRHN